MRSSYWLVVVGLVTLLGAPSPSSAGGNVVRITAIRGRVEIKPLEGGGSWRRAELGELQGTFLLRTGPRSWAHLQEAGAWRPRRLDRGCVDANSLLRVGSWGCGFQIEVLRGRISAVDGRRGKGRFRSVGG